MGNQYANSLVPEPYTILGLKLKPFSLGHLMLFRRFDVAYGSDVVTNVDINDLLLGIYICSQSYESFMEHLEKNDFSEWATSWGEAIVDSAGLDIDEILQDREELFEAYLQEAKIKPYYWDESNSKSQSGIDWPQGVLTLLTSELGYTRSEALNAPLGQSLNDYLIYAERQGSIRLMTDAEIEQSEKLALEEKASKKKASKKRTSKKKAKKKVKKNGN